MLRKAGRKLQSAMEYLMTYGWAILIIAIVLGALFQLGIFNSINFAPRAPPGSCRVFRSPAGGAQNLQGVCSGQLPQYIAQFNGQSSYINLIQIPQEAGTNSITFAVWFKTLSTPNSWPMIFGDTAGSPRNGYDLFVGGPGAGSPNQLAVERFVAGVSVGITASNSLSFNTWYFAVVTYDGSQMKLYLNGILAAAPTSSSSSINLNSVTSLGAISGSGLFGNYQIANFEVYNTSLSPSDVQALYISGIGGAPQNLQNLIGWWPLNGDVNDYSRNNNGAPTNIVYTNQWLSGYTPP